MKQLAGLCLLLIALFNEAATAAGAQQIAEFQQCRLSSGASISPCLIGYRTLGKINESRDNVIIFPTWLTGTTGELMDYDLIGPEKLADTGRYYVIAIDALGNGVSSSPSNTPPENGEFPEISISDMVNTQYLLLTEVLNIDHVHGVIGISMGGMQTFQWISQYPAFMDYAVSIDGSPTMTSYDILQWQTHRNTIRTLQRYGAGNREIMDVITGLSLLTSRTPDYFVKNFTPEKISGFVKEEQGRLSGLHADDYVAQLTAVLNHDIYRAGGKPATQMAPHITAKIMVVSVATDQMVNPAPALKLADVIGAQKLVLDNDCGHLGTVCEQERVAAAVNRFLDGTSMTGTAAYD